MGIFSSKQTKAPHLQFPEILHWQEGDIIKARNVGAKNIISKLNAIETGKFTKKYVYKGITRDGSIIVEDQEDEIAHKVDLKKFLKKAENRSLTNRNIYSDLDTSNEYMALISEFQKAYLELSNNDEDTKLLEE